MHIHGLSHRPARSLLSACAALGIALALLHACASDKAEPDRQEVLRDLVSVVMLPEYEELVSASKALVEGERGPRGCTFGRQAARGASGFSHVARPLQSERGFLFRPRCRHLHHRRSHRQLAHGWRKSRGARRRRQARGCGRRCAPRRKPARLSRARVPAVRQRGRRRGRARAATRRGPGRAPPGACREPGRRPESELRACARELG